MSIHVIAGTGRNGDNYRVAEFIPLPGAEIDIRVLRTCRTFDEAREQLLHAIRESLDEGEPE